MSLWSQAVNKYRKEGLFPLFKSTTDLATDSQIGIQQTITNPAVLRGHIRENILKQANNKISYQNPLEDGVRIMEKDWDNLLILDACRYDMFSEQIDLKGKLTLETSVAPETSRFVRRNFGDDEYHDTVYVSANPKIPKLVPDKTFHNVIPVWESHWNEEMGSVMPQVLTEQAIKASKQYPHKRLIVHYVQPHAPLIGPKGRKFMRDAGLSGMNPRSGSERLRKLYPAMRYGLLDLSDKQLKELYAENLQVALEAITDHIKEFQGKTVITSDYGELLGDTVGKLPMKGYGHPSPLHVKELLHVPWFEVEHGWRKEIRESPPQKNSKADETVAVERLKDLGYL